MLGWTPEVAWNASIPEILVAGKAFGRYHFGVEDDPKPLGVDEITRRMDNIMTKQNERMEAANGN